MLVFFCLEASRPRGTSYRLSLGCMLHPNLASMVAVNRRWIGTPDQHPKGTPSFCVSND
jgi:hypothetical protein